MILDLATVKAGMQFTDVDVYVSSFTKKFFGSEGKYSGDGVLYCEGATLKLKVWDMMTVDSLMKIGVSGKAVTVSGNVTEYNNALQLVASKVSINTTLTKLDFLKTEGVEENKTEFFNFINTKISQPYISALLCVFNQAGVLNLFCAEFAGAKMHDAKVGGLLHHTLKMLRLADTLIQNDERLQPYSDIILSGILLHDIGKIKEMNLGTYTPNSFVTHRLLGVEMLAKEKDAIVGLIGETNYYHLQAIIQGHHGQWGEAPKTVWAYVVHLIDMLESATTGIMDKLERREYAEENGIKKVYANDSNLVL